MFRCVQTDTWSVSNCNPVGTYSAHACAASNEALDHNVLAVSKSLPDADACFEQPFSNRKSCNMSPQLYSQFFPTAVASVLESVWLHRTLSWTQCVALWPCQLSEAWVH